MRKVSRTRARQVGDLLRVNWRKIDLEQLRVGIEHEQEHTSDLERAARIALDHLYETPDYYTRLEKAGLEAGEGEEFYVYVRHQRSWLGSPHDFNMTLGPVYSRLEDAVAAGRSMLEKPTHNPVIAFYVADREGRRVTEIIGRGQENPARRIFKRCRCGRTFTKAQWEELPYVGVQPTYDERGSMLELRNCPCGSTIAVEMPSKRWRENPVTANGGAALVCMGRQVELVLRDGREVKPGARVGMLYDSTGTYWPATSLLVMSFDQGNAETAHGHDYFGKQARVLEGSVEPPPKSLSSWTKLGEIEEVYYDRAGTKHPGFFRHVFNKPKGLYKVLFMFKKAGKLPAVLYQCETAFRIELPRGSIVDDRGIVMP